MLWSLQHDCDIFDALVSPERYAINVLSSEQEALSRAYARRGAHEMETAHYEPGANGAPLVRDALAFFECTLDATHEGGDHTIIVGRVTRFAAREGGEPLVFYQGAYRALAAR